TFAGIRDEGQRADLIAYLHSLSNDPVPLPGGGGEGAAEAPAEEAAEPPAAAEAPAEEAAAAPAEPAPPAPMEEAAEPAAPAGDAAEAPAEGDAAAEAAGGAPAIAPLLAAADPEAGQRAGRVCIACHTFEEGGATRVGPNLWDVVGRPIASVEGFNYSEALQEHAAEAGEWSFAELDAFLAAPRDHVPGTTMTFAGIRDEGQRADLIAYLRSLSNDPVPLPGQ